MNARSVHQWDTGDKPDPLTVTVTRELNDQYLYGQSDYHELYTRHADPIVHPALLLNLSNMTNSPTFFRSPEVGGLHAADEADFKNPVDVGSQVTIAWEITDIYEKRGKTYHLRTAVVTDDTRHRVALERRTTIAFVNKKILQETAS